MWGSLALLDNVSFSGGAESSKYWKGVLIQAALQQISCIHGCICQRESTSNMFDLRKIKHHNVTM